MGKQAPERIYTMKAKLFHECLEETRQEDAMRALKQAIATWRKSLRKPVQAPKPPQRKQRVQRVEPGAGSYRHPNDLDYP
jgi:protein subunit release factor B